MSGNKGSRSALRREVIIGINSYDDLFSDFDPRPFSQKAVSDDFMSELNKLIVENDEHIKALIFQMPHSARNPQSEEMIAKRLEHDFARIHANVSHDLQAMYSGGIIKAVIGVAALMGALSVNTLNLSSLWRNLCTVILEPAGWFFIWSGLEEALNGSRLPKLKRNFYARLRRCKIEFASDNIT